MLELKLCESYIVAFYTLSLSA